MTSDTEQLWEQLHAGLRGFVSRRVRNSADVDDVVQRVFLNVHRGLGSVRDEDRVHAWVYRTAQHAIVDYYRQPVNRREIPAGDLGDLAEAPRRGPDQADQVDEDDRPAQQEFAACVQPLLRALPAADLEALTLVDIHGVTQTDAAQRLGLSVSGMKSRVQRARRRFRTIVEDCCRVDLDRRGGIVAYEPRSPNACGCGCHETTGEHTAGTEAAIPASCPPPRS